VAVGNGFLQSLVESTPARQGQTYLRKLYDKVHELEGMFGKSMYFTEITLSPELVRFLDIWVEGPTKTSGIFLVPRIIQKDWGYICKHVLVLGEYYPGTLPEMCSYNSRIPFVLLYVPRYVRCLPLPSLVGSTPTPLHGKWHTEQADHLRGL
jgi:hypothetical protein